MLIYVIKVSEEFDSAAGLWYFKSVESMRKKFDAVVSEILNDNNNKIEYQSNNQIIQHKTDLRMVTLRFTHTKENEDYYTEERIRITIYEDIVETED